MESDKDIRLEKDDLEVENNIERISSEKEDDYSDDDLFNISSYGADLSFRELISMYTEGELQKPELQRYYVWDKSEASRFVESLLLGLPVPSIFLAKTKDENKIIVDGYQRIMTVYEYVEKQMFSKDNKVFKLSNSNKINQRWRGKAFSELSDTEQKKIRSTTIHAIIFEQKEPKTDSSMYQVFERINTSGRTLLPQEIRNCIYQGTLNTLLFKLNKEVLWRKLFGLEQEDLRMRDLEYILRFFGLQQLDIKNQTKGQISIKKYLNDFMEKERCLSISKETNYEQLFVGTMQYLNANLGENAFRNIGKDGNFTDKFHPTVFDAIAIASAYAILKNKISEGIDLNNRRIKLLNDESFKLYISTRTTNIEHINGRISLALKYLYNIKYE